MVKEKQQKEEMKEEDNDIMMDTEEFVIPMNLQKEMNYRRKNISATPVIRARKFNNRLYQK